MIKYSELLGLNQILPRGTLNNHGKPQSRQSAASVWISCRDLPNIERKSSIRQPRRYFPEALSSNLSLVTTYSQFIRGFPQLFRINAGNVPSWKPGLTSCSLFDVILSPHSTYRPVTYFLQLTDKVLLIESQQFMLLRRNMFIPRLLYIVCLYCRVEQT